MDLSITPMKIGEKKPSPVPDRRLFEILGEQGIRNMISQQYDLLAKSEIKELFPPQGKGLDMAKQHSADYIIQRFGGPAIYNERRGKPMLINRHKDFNITKRAREVWLECYREALVQQDLPEDVKLSFWNFFDSFSNWLVNED